MEKRICRECRRIVPKSGKNGLLGVPRGAYKMVAEKKKRLHLSLSSEIYDELRDIAEETGQTYSETAQMVLHDALSSRKKYIAFELQRAYKLVALWEMKAKIFNSQDIIRQRVEQRLEKIEVRGE